MMRLVLRLCIENAYKHTLFADVLFLFLFLHWLHQNLSVSLLLCSPILFVHTTYSSGVNFLHLAIFLWRNLAKPKKNYLHPIICIFKFFLHI